MDGAAVRMVSRSALALFRIYCSVTVTALQRSTLSKIVSTFLVHTNGLGFSLFRRINSLMANTRSDTLLNTPRRIRLRVISPNHRSTRLSQEEEVGVKWQ
jgi:hypothetical protein